MPLEPSQNYMFDVTMVDRSRCAGTTIAVASNMTERGRTLLRSDAGEPDFACRHHDPKYRS